VASKITKGALPAFSACNHLEIHNHHLSPGFKPGKFQCGMGVIKSFPLEAEYSKNSLVIIAQRV